MLLFQNKKKAESVLFSKKKFLTHCKDEPYQSNGTLLFAARALSGPVDVNPSGLGRKHTLSCFLDQQIQKSLLSPVLQRSLDHRRGFPCLALRIQERNELPL